MTDYQSGSGVYTIPSGKNIEITLPCNGGGYGEISYLEDGRQFITVEPGKTYQIVIGPGGSERNLVDEHQFSDLPPICWALLRSTLGAHRTPGYMYEMAEPHYPPFNTMLDWAHQRDYLFNSCF